MSDLKKIGVTLRKLGDTLGKHKLISLDLEKKIKSLVCSETERERERTKLRYEEKERERERER